MRAVWDEERGGSAGHYRYVGRCSLCEHVRPLWYRTPADPPFYPRRGGRHCAACNHWLKTGEDLSWPSWRVALAAVAALLTLALLAGLIGMVR